jgi:NADPH:quinone reductase-like Zn-dependent oxidoreductase
MKALIVEQYGPPQSHRIAETDRPVPGNNEILIRVTATAVNDYDWSLIRGKPYIYRLMFGLRKPKAKIPGMELAGVVEATGPGATRFKPGDHVFGDTSDFGFGSFAEYIAVHENAVVKKPRGLSDEIATALPHAAALALQGLVNSGGIRNGEKVLINGAGGGVGAIGLCLARHYHAEVTGVDSQSKHSNMLASGFDHVIDYTTTDFTRTNEEYDLILDAKTSRSGFDYMRALSPGGRYVTVGGHLPRLLQVLLLKPFVSWFSSKQFHIVALKPNQDLEYLADLTLNNTIKPVIDGPYPLDELPQRIQYFGEGRHCGKVVISMPQPDTRDDVPTR